jgi:hypothetical protein
MQKKKTLSKPKKNDIIFDLRYVFISRTNFNYLKNYIYE